MGKRLLNVIVVDDELPLRQELRSFPWEAWGASLIGEAENGDDALRLCRDSVPDVVVTDITMPLMDGLELFRRLKAELPAVQVILLTCHSEFAYAKEALKLGALEYLVKVTLDENDLAAALDKAREVIERERAHKQKEGDTRRREQSKRLVKLLKDNEASEAEIAAGLNAVGIWNGLPGRCMLLAAEGSGEDAVFIAREVELALEQMEPETTPGYSWVPVGGGQYALVFREHSLTVAQLKASLGAIVRGLKQTLDANLPYLSREVSVYAAIGESAPDAVHFVQSFRSAASWAAAKFYEPDAEQPVFVGRPVPLAAFGREHEQQLAEAVHRCGAGPDGALKSYFQTEFVRWSLKHRFDPAELKRAVVQLMTEWLARPGEHAVQEKPASTLAAMSEASSLQELSALAVHAAELKGGAQRRMRKEVRDARAYLESHLADPITLQELAGVAGLSAHYLSRLFREETGESISECMTRLRMEKAIRLLQHTNLKVYEVAEQVGIPSYRYFSTMFREWTGVAPTDYKKSKS